MTNLYLILIVNLFFSLTIPEIAYSFKTVEKLVADNTLTKLDEVAAVKFDKYKNIAPELERTRLKRFVKELNKKKNVYSSIEIIVYGGCQGESESHVKTIRDYLVNNQRVNENRIHMRGKGCWKNSRVELWIIPPGAQRPPDGEAERIECKVCKSNSR